MPDRLSIVIPISHYVYPEGTPKTLSEPEFLAGFVEHLLNPPFPSEVIGKPKFVNQGQDWRATTLDFGARESRVHFSYHKHKSTGLSLRLEMNPRKLGETGFKQLRKLLGKSFGLKGLVEAARVTRLDVAVDVVGVHVSEVVARYKKQGKRSYYIGNNGALETVYIHRKTPPFKQKFDDGGAIKALHSRQPAGQAVLRVYDRVAERAALGKPAPFGEAPVTRTEFVKDRFKKFHLANLASMPDPLKEIWAGYAPSQKSGPAALWRRYVAAVRTESPADLQKLFGLSPDIAKKFEKALRVPVPDLLAPKVTWEGWNIGIASTGLNLLLDVD